VIGCVALNLVSFVVYLVLLSPLRSAETRRTEPLRHSFVEGLRFVVTKRKATLPLLVGSVFALVGFHFDRSTLPLFAVEHLHASPHTYGLLLAASPLGAVLLLGVSRARRVQQLPSRIIVTGIALGAGLALLSLTTHTFTAFLLLLLTGASRGIHYNAIATLLQLKVPDALRGRVFSFYNLAGGLFGLGGMIMNGLAPTLGLWVSERAGALRGLPDPHGLRGAMLLAAATTTLCAMIFLPALRRLTTEGDLDSDELIGLRERRETPSIPRL
jgi:MFS family permease